jgi:predicted enzyme related to lactoylglutathione lyase
MDDQFSRRRSGRDDEAMKASGIAVELDPESYPNGRFARLHDPEGNPIELRQPAGRDGTRQS